MDDNYTVDNVRSRLILAGLKELDKHGVVDFSLRRVAIESGVSCAAPYRHFKDKDDLISSIISYVMEGWAALSRQIMELYSSDMMGLVSELSVAGFRFWIANGNFRTVIMNFERSSDHQDPISEFEQPIIASIRACSSDISISEVEFKVLSALYGAISLVDAGRYSVDVAADVLRRSVSDIMKQYG